MANEYILEQTASDVQKAINNALNPDTTLSESGVPADAGAVGELVKRIDVLEGDEPTYELVEQENTIDPDVISSNYTGGLYLSSTHKWYPLSSWFSTTLIPMGSERPATIYLYGFASGTNAHITFYTEDATEETPEEGVVGNNVLNVNYGFTFDLDSFTADSGYVSCEATTDSEGNACHAITFLAGWAGDARYFRLGLKDANIAAGARKYDTLYACLGERYSYVEIPTDADTEEYISQLGRQWKGAKWLAIGTSLTSEAQGQWANPMVELSGLELTNQAVPGASMGGHILYYAQNSTYLASADIVTVEGAVNDYAAARPLGEVGDTVPYAYTFTSPEWDNGGNDDEGTFAGACYQVFKAVLENAQNAVVVCITDPTGQNIASTGAYYGRNQRNSLGHSQRDYSNMLKAVAEYMGVTVVDTATIGGITEEHPEYYVDHLHHTELGGQQWASVIWSKVRNIPCRITE